MILAFKSLKRVSQVKNGGGKGGIADSDYLVKKKKAWMPRYIELLEQSNRYFCNIKYKEQFISEILYNYNKQYHTL